MISHKEKEDTIIYEHVYRNTDNFIASAHVITSITCITKGKHSELTIFSRGAACGKLTVNAHDAYEIAGRLIG